MSEVLNNYSSDEIVFALDIGTRSVVGIVGVIKEDTFEVIDFEQVFHEQRAMRDGQIEDINKVSKVVNIVKTKLEERLDIVLDKVAIAAAGRSLKTIKTTYEQDIDPLEQLTEKNIRGIEYSAISSTMEQFKDTFNEETKDIDNDIYTGYYCVGYSVVTYTLDDYNMANLVGHKGNHVKIDLIAAFLPHNVVEGLYAVMRINNLEIINLTLEPMAAINVIVQKDIRLLNIAIVDIGAGTSDIAISKNGSIVAYDMVTIAGDEITETIMGHYLTDFDTAENIKIALNKADDIVFNDILGNEYNITVDEVLEIINPSIDLLAKTISKHILEINGASPVAVFIVGGGSQIDGLCKIIANELKLIENRVVVGGKQGFKYVTINDETLKNPEFVTPIGIAAILSSQKGNDFFSITVNDKKVMILSQGQMNVMDVLLLAGIKPSKLISNGGAVLNYYINAVKKTYRPALLQDSVLTKNGVAVGIEATIERGDKITALPKVYEKLQHMTIKEALKEYEEFFIYYDGEKVVIPYIVTVNDNIVKDNYIIKQFDRIIFKKIDTIKEISIFLGLEDMDFDFYINDEKAGQEAIINSGDMLIVKKNKTSNILASTNVEDSKDKRVVNIVKEIVVFLNGEKINIVSDTNEVTFVDALNYVNIETKNPVGELILKLNGEDANYIMPLKNGDSLEIYWKS